MQSLQIGNVVIACEDGIVTFDDPLRGAPLCINYDDFPLLLDMLDRVEWDRRRAFRVPVWTESQLTAAVEYDGITYDGVEPVDLSLAGILINLGDSDAPDLVMNDTLNVTLRLDDIKATLSGVVRRSVGRRYGIVFPASLHRQQVNPPLQLRLIVNRLESQWLSKRIRETQEAECSPVSAD